eukprot:385322-Rhodomonas_salina.2
MILLSATRLRWAEERAARVSVQTTDGKADDQRYLPATRTSHIVLVVDRYCQRKTRKELSRHL